MVSLVLSLELAVHRLCIHTPSLAVAATSASLRHKPSPALALCLLDYAPSIMFAVGGEEYPSSGEGCVRFGGCGKALLFELSWGELRSKAACVPLWLCAIAVDGSSDEERTTGAAVVVASCCLDLGAEIARAAAAGPGTAGAFAQASAKLATSAGEEQATLEYAVRVSCIREGAPASAETVPCAKASPPFTEPLAVALDAVVDLPVSENANLVNIGADFPEELVLRSSPPAQQPTTTHVDVPPADFAVSKGPCAATSRTPVTLGADFPPEFVLQTRSRIGSGVPGGEMHGHGGFGASAAGSVMLKDSNVGAPSLDTQGAGGSGAYHGNELELARGLPFSPSVCPSMPQQQNSLALTSASLATPLKHSPGIAGEPFGSATLFKPAHGDSAQSFERRAGVHAEAPSLLLVSEMTRELCQTSTGGVGSLGCAF